MGGEEKRPGGYLTSSLYDDEDGDDDDFNMSMIGFKKVVGSGSDVNMSKKLRRNRGSR